MLVWVEVSRFGVSPGGSWLGPPMQSSFRNSAALVGLVLQAERARPFQPCSTRLTQAPDPADRSTGRVRVSYRAFRKAGASSTIAASSR
ncbi:hypothetical protein BJ964_006743 [Actinoplanes lobatus]|uniref:Uncharacterized protein n=1 Tax=Actinoplanes lobatus TaxID=113568 RepID=A0A7W7MJF1_9ACTN|nr:hypothetical protein [Actinoplanes lobatus]